MAIEVNLDAANDDERDPRRLEPGEYVVRCVNAVVGESPRGKQRVKLTLQVADGEAKDRQIYDDVYTTGKAQPRLVLALEAFGVPFTKDDLVLRFDEVQFIGRAATVTVEHETYNDKTRPRVPYGGYAPAPAEFAEPEPAVVAPAVDDDAEAIPF